MLGPSRAQRRAHITEVSPLTLNRLSVYLRCLRHLKEVGVRRVSSRELAQQYHLSSVQIRKDLTQFGEFGIRGVGYDVDKLAARLTELLGLDRQRRLMIVGMGNLGSALARYPGFNSESFQVVAGVDSDPDKVGRLIGRIIIRHADELQDAVREAGADIGVLALPAVAAQEAYDRLVDAGIKAVLNFAPLQLKQDPATRVKNVDLGINLEELAFYLQRDRSESSTPRSAPGRRS